MKFTNTHFIGSMVVVLLLTACSTRKNKFLNRNWHAMNTYYNTIYNGNLAIEKGIRDVEREYPENYWDILPVERMQERTEEPDLFDSELNTSEAKNPDFKRAEDKATKAIQKHAMFIGGEEHNFEMDETFILLGKARYYSHRYVQAKDAFMYVLNHYPESSTIVEAKIWLEKTNMRMKYYELALQNLLKIQAEYPNLKHQEQTHLNSILAEAHILNNNFSKAIQPLNKAISYAKNDTLKGRLLYIKAQLFQELNQPDSVNYTYQKVIELNRKSPRTYMIHAKLEQIKNINRDTAQYAFMQSLYKPLIEDRENRPFLDFIYFDFAEFHNNLDSIDLAIEYYNKSLDRKPQDKYLYSRDYLRLAEIYFDKKNYKTAGAYYDSTLTHLDKSKREFRQISKKRKNLDDVIKYEALADEKDSIIRLIKMDKAERITFFEEYIDKLKDEAQSVFAQKTASQRAIGRSNAQFNTASNQNVTNPSSNNSNVNFYFYDQNQVNKGILAFQQKWGNIALGDDWKYNSRSAPTANANNNQKPDEDPFADDPKYQTKTYLARIPKDDIVIDSIWIERNFAYYQLGVIYKEKFKEYESAKYRFENLLDNKPEQRLVLPSIYNLYLISKEVNDKRGKEYWKNKILNEYPESEYATLLLNPQQFKNSENNPQNIYKRLYEAYENQQYQEVVQQTSRYAKQFTGRPIAPKFDLLNAYAIAKIKGVEAYKKALNHVALTYPQSEEGKFAQKKYKELNRAFKSKEFLADTNSQNYKLVYSLIDARKDDFLEKIKSSLEKLEYNYKVTEETYKANHKFVVINGLKSMLGANGLAEIFIKEDLISKEFDYFAISEENYSIIQIYKNLDQYLNHLNQ